MSPDESAALLARRRAGDAGAANDVFRRYVGRLLALIRSRLAGRLARREAAEDVAQSVFRLFFDRAARPDFLNANSAGLWHRLALMALRKVRDRCDRHHAARRSVEREEPLGDGGEGAFDRLLEGREPAHEEAVALEDELATLLGRLPPRDRRVVELRLLGLSQEEVAGQVGCTDRTVRNVLGRIEDEFTRRLLGPAD